MAWTLTVRAGPRVERARYETLEQALDELERRARRQLAQAPRDPVDTKIQRFEPEQRVVARLEVAGPQRLLPNVRGGVDVRGDGSTEAYRGRVRRELVDVRRGESAYQALRRALSGT